MKYADLQFIQPRSYSPGRPAGPPRLIVIHYTAGAARPGAARDGAAYDQRRTDGTSAHYYIDNGEVVQCIDTDDRSHTALRNGNEYGIHYELCTTNVSRSTWLNDYHRAVIRNTARQAARDMAHYGIPLVRLQGAQVRPSTAKGICGHADCTTGWPEDNGDHMDPGPGFPYDVLFADIREFFGQSTQEEDMTPEEFKDIRIPVKSFDGKTTFTRSVEELFTGFAEYGNELIRVKQRLDRIEGNTSRQQIVAALQSVDLPDVDVDQLADAIAEQLNSTTVQETADAVVDALGDKLKEPSK